jgi:hypothetical protein
MLSVLNFATQWCETANVLFFHCCKLVSLKFFYIGKCWVSASKWIHEAVCKLLLVISSRVEGYIKIVNALMSLPSHHIKLKFKSYCTWFFCC